MIDQLADRANVVALRGDSYRLKDRDLGPLRRASLANIKNEVVPHSVSKLALFSVGIDTPGKSSL